MKGACIVGQSGGPTSVINSSVAGVVLSALKNENITEVYGALNGLSGIINENIIDFKKEEIEEIELLKYTPSAALGSVRLFLDDYKVNSDIHQKILNVFKKYNIRYFFYIGGNDSMDSCHKINEYLKSQDYECRVIGIPKTIDNDLVCCDHTPGYGSACKFIATTISEIYLDINAYTKGRVTIVEVMGRDAGWLTASSKLASLNDCDPDLIYLPETAFNVEDFLEKVNNIYTKNKKAFIIVSEGIKDANGEYILKYRNFNNNDSFGHMQLGGVASVLCEIVSNKFGFPVRAIELNLPQRCASHLSSKTDIDEAYMCGEKGVEFATTGVTGKMITIERNNNIFTYGTTDLKNVAAQVKNVPLNFISENGDNITQEYINYALPLIQGEPNVTYVNGLPKFSKLKKILINKK